jgi:hypothetical protein
MLKTPSEHDLCFVLAVLLSDGLNDRVVKSHSTSEGTPSLGADRQHVIIHPL